MASQHCDHAQQQSVAEHCESLADNVADEGVLRCAGGANRSHVSMQPNCCDAVAIVLTEHAEKVKVVDLSENGFGVHNPTMCHFPPICSALPSHLLSLKLSRNPHIGDEGAELLSAQLKHMRHLECFEIVFNLFGARPMRHISGHLPSSLLELALGGNQFDVAGAKVLAGRLPRLKKLDSLVLVNAGLGDDEWEALAPGLAALPALGTLEANNFLLGDDSISERSGEAQLEFFGKLENRLGDKGAVALCEALPGKLGSSGKCGYMILEGPVMDDGIKALQAAMKTSKIGLCRVYTPADPEFPFGPKDTLFDHRK